MTITVNAQQLIKNIMIRTAESPEAEVRYNDIYNALVTMIKWTRQFKQREEIIQLSQGIISPLMWAKELCTVKFCLPRQSGHTTFIKRMLEKIGPSGVQSKMFEHPALIFPNTSVCGNCGFPPGWPWVGTPHDMNKMRGMRWDSVIVDCSSLLSNKHIEKIYNFFKHDALSNPNFVYIFIE